MDILVLSSSVDHGGAMIKNFGAQMHQVRLIWQGKSLKWNRWTATLPLGSVAGSEKNFVFFGGGARSKGLQGSGLQGSEEVGPGGFALRTLEKL